MPEKRIVVVGAGFGGLTAALTLANDPALISRGYEVILIDRHRHHLYTPGLYEIAAVPREYAKDHYLVSSSLIAVREIIRGRQIRFIQGELAGLDAARRRIRLKSGGTLAYEFLILALGSETNYFGIPGLSEYSVPLKTCDDAAQLRNAIEAAVRRKPSLAVVIGGAGATGVELAAELVNFICTLEQSISKFRNIEMSGRMRCATKITLVEAAKQILPGFGRRLARDARKRLEHLGVEVRTGDPLIAASKKDVTLRSGERLPYDLLIWTGGVKGPAVLRRLGLPLSPKQTLVADPALRAGNPEDQIFAVGDNAWFINQRTKKPVAWNVPAAEAEGKHAAKQISRIVCGRKPRRFRPLRRYPFILAVGRKYAIANLASLRFDGLLGWWAKQLVGLRYFLFLLPWSRALRLWWRNIGLYRAND